MTERLTDVDIGKSATRGVNLNVKDRLTVCASYLCVLHAIEVGEHLGRAGLSYAGCINLSVFERIEECLGLHLLEDNRIKLWLITPPVGILLEGHLRVTNRVNGKRTCTPLSMWIIGPTIIEGININCRWV